MKKSSKGTWLINSIMLLIFSPLTHATLRPMVSLSVGSDSARMSLHQNVTLLEPFQNTYISTTNRDAESVFGFFMGAESTLARNLLWQLGLSYYQSSSFAANGEVYQFADPAFNNLGYQFQIQSRRILLETKLLTSFQQRYHPYLTGGIGESINNAYGYNETPLTSDAAPMSEPFNGHVTHAFTYTIGAGLDYDIDSHIRVGAGYRFLDLGRSALGTTPIQTSTEHLFFHHMYANEFLFQLSLLS